MIQNDNFMNSVTFRIILVNIFAFILFLILSLFYDFNVLLSLFALQPTSIIRGEKLWTLLTSVFLHIEVWHLLANMISLYFVGNFVERLIGKRRYLIFYLISGIFAGLFWVIVSNFLSFTPMLARVFGHPSVFGVGASGAVFGLLGILALLTPRARVSFIAGPLVAFIIIGVLSGSTILSPEILGLLDILFFVYIIITFTAMFSFNPRLLRLALPVNTNMANLAIIAIIPLVILSLFVDLPIGNMAHLGGLISGLLYASYLRNKYPRRSKMISHMFK